MNDKNESWLIKFLKHIGIIRTYEVSKSEMCKNAQSICSHDCDNCAWN